MDAWTAMMFFALLLLTNVLLDTALATSLLKFGGFFALNLDVRAVSLNRTVCLGPLGCFSNNSPFYDERRRPVSLLPFDRSALDVQFYLYSRRNPTSGVAVSADDARTLANFSADKETKVVIHGLMDNIVYGGWLEDIKKEYLIRSDCNVILVDWARANRLPYEQAVANARAVGAELAFLIRKMMRTRGAKPERFHLIGHSLGAHVAGYTGERLPNIARITGLDPAGPYFTGTDPLVRLDPTDAKFVDVIHTDAATSVLTGLGTVDSMGHVDFYPNGGNDQPGCSPISNVPSIFYKSLARSLTNVLGFCDHMRAGEIFASSIPNSSCLPTGVSCTSWTHFLAGQCGDCNSSKCLPMGERSSNHYTKSMNGQRFYLITADTEPYCQFQYFISMSLEKKRQTSSVVGEAYLVLQGSNGTLHTKLSRRTETFNPERTTTYLVTSKSDLGDIGHVRFYWIEDDAHRGREAGPTGRPKMYIKAIRVSALQMAREYQRTNTCFTFKEAIAPGKEVELLVIGKC